MGGRSSKQTTTTTTATTTTTTTTTTAAPTAAPTTTRAVPTTTPAPVLERLNTEQQIIIAFSCLGLLLIITAVVAVYFLWRRKALARKPVGGRNEVIERTGATDTEVPVCVTESTYANVPEKRPREPAETVTYSELTIRRGTDRASPQPSETTEYACVHVNDA
ncbi:hypothetical protein ANANG_G00228850 [Anguilla anguilla]|uniref:Uncharacterized protein n=1 Tax=Anguilla anguilla TaxID=7936 RepID=A0A9D3LXR1_ANGAN|nr:hypothetical protein ANANG_G00228850 [Anguilla anguilla]